MDAPRDCHNKQSQKEKDKYNMTLLLCVMTNMAYMNLCMKQKQTHRPKEHTYSCQECGGWERNELGVWDY